MHSDTYPMITLSGAVATLRFANRLYEVCVFEWKVVSWSGSFVESNIGISIPTQPRAEARDLETLIICASEDAEHFEGESGLKEYTTPENLMLTEEIKQTVFKAIEALPEDLKSAITLREIEGLSYEEIAAVMDCPIGTVRSRIFRARDAIDKELRPLLE